MVLEVGWPAKGGFLCDAKRTNNFHPTVRRWYQVLLELPPTIEMEVAWLSIHFKVTVEGHPVEGTVSLGRTHSIGWHWHKKNHDTIVVPWQHSLEGQKQISIFMVYMYRVWKGLHDRTWT